ncbi:hypothetical protein N184_32810 [Sinorhizobium sp. GL28]|nr:hypothetical protein N184_32810 [Sinorhizobium sp. GL28]
MTIFFTRHSITLLTITSSEYYYITAVSIIVFLAQILTK